ncbi:MAG TPA: sulfatase-like hydrolase/transferase, partial [Isosphaeraceae bacterium]|nr:sulfatase-like hydrolase/transferase [Isosphaeraceae bacterium]
MISSRPVRLFAVLLISALAASPAFAKNPNLIVIMADDMGFSDIGCYGGEIATPNLDRLAANGVRFTQFYNTSRCCPTRASLLTGLYPHQAGVGHMMDDRGYPGYTGNLNKSCRTMAEVLKTAGYRTYATGKWHVTRFAGAEGPKYNWPLHRGFDHFYGTIHGAGSFYDPSSLVHDDTMISPYADPDYKPETYYYTDAIADHAIQFLDDHKQNHDDQPFFLYCTFTSAHWPMHALPEDIARYKGKYDNGYAPIRAARLKKAAELGLIAASQGLTDQAGDWSKVVHREWEIACMEVYAAMIDRMDQNIGKLIAQLEKSGELDNTLIFFLQDNGGCAEDMGRKGNEKHPNI